MAMAMLAQATAAATLESQRPEQRQQLLHCLSRMLLLRLELARKEALASRQEKRASPPVQGRRRD